MPTPPTARTGTVPETFMPHQHNQLRHRPPALTATAARPGCRNCSPRSRLRIRKRFSRTPSGWPRRGSGGSQTDSKRNFTIAPIVLKSLGISRPFDSLSIKSVKSSSSTLTELHFDRGYRSMNLSCGRSFPGGRDTIFEIAIQRFENRPWSYPWKNEV
jgi:hypothetical protein